MPTRRDVDLATVPRASWADFLAQLQWRQGEHVSLIGPTGGGKTTLALALLPRREWTAVLATKPKDRTLDRLRRNGYRRLREWPPAWGINRVLLWPRWRGPADTHNQRQVFLDAMDDIFHRGGWAICADELAYMCQMLKLDSYLKLLWQQGRSIDISLMGCTQRPAFVPLELYSQASHLFIWRQTDKRDLDRIGGIGTVDPALVRSIVRQLPRHQFLYVNTRTDEFCVSQVEL